MKIVTDKVNIKKSNVALLNICRWYEIIENEKSGMQINEGITWYTNNKTTKLSW